MALFNKDFHLGKMNKDMDERVVLKGEYRDAMNLQVQTSDGSNMGAAQTLMGNVLVSQDLVPPGSTCVGSIANNKEDKIYYLVAGPEPLDQDWDTSSAWKDYIIEYDIKTEKFKYVFVDIYRANFKVLSSNPTTNPMLSGEIQLEEIVSNPFTHVRNGMLADSFSSAGFAGVAQHNNGATEVIPKLLDNTVKLFSTYTNFTTETPVAGDWLNFSAKRVLNFHKDRYITGINIIDGMLFWTDNFSEPKKINIERCIAGTGGFEYLPLAMPGIFDGDTDIFHTRLCVTPDKSNPLTIKLRNQDEPWFIKEENITVIRKHPLAAPLLKMSKHEDGRVDANGNPVVTFSTTGGLPGNIGGPPQVDNNSFSYQASNGFNYIKSVGDLLQDVYVVDEVFWLVGDTILFNQNQEDDVSVEGFTEHDVRCSVTASPTTPSSTSGSTGPFEFKIESIDEEAIDEEQKNWNLRLEEKKPMFEFKIPRFAYRYKYEDGEYSTFSPFSQPAFLPGPFDYLPKKAYNLGMTNRLRSLRITNYVVEESLRPQDVVEIDLLYKEESSPNIYTVETIKMTDGWNKDDLLLWPDSVTGPMDTNNNPLVNPNAFHRGEYIVTSELIHATVPSNQLLRQWDNVPRVARAQEITSNRLVYGNYLQNYNLLSEFSPDLEIKPKIVVSLSPEVCSLGATFLDDDPNNPEGQVVTTNFVDDEFETIGSPLPHKTCRSLREYQVGVVYGDEHGRETPVLAGDGATGTLNIPKEHSSTANKLQVQLASNAPDWAKYFKFFVKETSNEYYNMAMDRFYDAEDGNIWLSFPSADRNKVDEETFIILKKKHDTHQPVDDPARYKIIAIENSAPDFIKTNIKDLGSVHNNADKDHIGTETLGFPLVDYDEVWIDDGALGLQEVFGSSTATQANFGGDTSSHKGTIYDKINAGTFFLRIRTSNVKSEWYQVSKMIDDGARYRFSIDGTFNEDVEFASEESFDTAIDDLRIQFANHQVENKKEFEGRFFVKIYKDLVLLQNLLVPKDKKYKVTNVSKMGYWNIPQGGRSNRSIFSFGVDWESYAVNCFANLAADDYVGGVLVTTNPGFKIADDPAPNSASNKTFFFYTARDGRQSGQKGPEFECDAKKGVKEWMRRSDGYFFIDACYTRAPAKKDFSFALLGNGCSRTLEGGSRGRGVFNNGLSMDIGYVFHEGYTWNNDLHKEFKSQISTKGTTFRFREDPDEMIYIITDSSSGSNHVNYQEDPGTANGRHRFRIDFELLDEPGVGLGNGPKGYHITGGNPYTKIKGNSNSAGEKELGWWGGRNTFDVPVTWSIEKRTFVTSNVFGGTVSNAIPYPLGGLLALALQVLEDAANSGGSTGATILVLNGDDYYKFVQYYDNIGGGGDDQGGSNNLVSKSAMNVPMPPGYTQGIGEVPGQGLTRIGYGDELATVVDASPIQQARRWRQHTSKYHHIEIVQLMDDDDSDFTSTNPAMWETEPKEDVGMDIYYEASSAIPIDINASTNELFAPIGSIVNGPSAFTPTNGIKVRSWSENLVNLHNPDDASFAGVTVRQGARIKFSKPDGSTSTAIVDVVYANDQPGYTDGDVVPFPIAAINQTSITIRGWRQPARPMSQLKNNDAPHNQIYTLSWFNAYAFGNGIESDRIRDDYNQTVIRNGVKASTVLAEQYKEDHRKTGLIHSGIYNSTSGINRLNQFIQAEKITKDMNPQYGSIQKLHTRDSNIVVLHEDKCMKVLANKDALFNADGGKNVAISSNFLGSDEPFATRYGISTNPESCATDLQGRLYFADRTRGAVLRLSNDGVTNIANYGMKDWFGDNLGPLTRQILGSFDEKKEEYNVTIKGLYPVNADSSSSSSSSTGCGCVDGNNGISQEASSDLGNFENTTILVTPNNLNIGDVSVGDKDFYNSQVTLSFSEKAKGWVSFKSFIPESGVSINNEYYTFKDGEMYKHHKNLQRNTFYEDLLGDDAFKESSVTLLFNDQPSTVKSFSTLNYEGSQAKNKVNITDSEYSNLVERDGWYVSDIKTNLQESSYLEFTGKEDKWFTFIKGDTTTLQNLDEKEFSVQGIGSYIHMLVVGAETKQDVCLTITPNINCAQVLGCMDPSALNYDANANVDDGTCTYPPEPIYGCTDPRATNYNSAATADDGSCEYEASSTNTCDGLPVLFKIGKTGDWNYTSPVGFYEVNGLGTGLPQAAGLNIMHGLQDAYSNNPQQNNSWYTTPFANQVMGVFTFLGNNNNNAYQDVNGYSYYKFIAILWNPNEGGVGVWLDYNNSSAGDPYRDGISSMLFYSHADFINYLNNAPSTLPGARDANENPWPMNTPASMTSPIKVAMDAVMGAEPSGVTLLTYGPGECLNT